MPSLILASTSPRRRELLRHLGVRFRVVAPLLDLEPPRHGESPADLAARLALEKARSVSGSHPDAWVFSADTVVALGRRVFGKPRDRADVVRSLRALSGRTHQVLTGMALLSPRGALRAGGCTLTRVEFRVLGRGEILRYSRKREAYDKAGGYAIQGTAAGWVSGWEGDYFNVVGLPLGWVADRLRENGLF